MLGPSGPSLAYFTAPDMCALKGTIDLKLVKEIRGDLKSKFHENAFSLVLDEREYFFHADSGEQRPNGTECLFPFSLSFSFFFGVVLRILTFLSLMLPFRTARGRFEDVAC